MCPKFIGYLKFQYWLNLYLNFSLQLATWTCTNICILGKLIKCVHSEKWMRQYRYYGNICIQVHYTWQKLLENKYIKCSLELGARYAPHEKLFLFFMSLFFLQPVQVLNLEEWPRRATEWYILLGLMRCGNPQKRFMNKWRLVYPRPHICQGKCKDFPLHQ